MSHESITNPVQPSPLIGNWLTGYKINPEFLWLGQDIRRNSLVFYIPILGHYSSEGVGFVVYNSRPPKAEKAFQDIWFNLQYHDPDQLLTDLGKKLVEILKPLEKEHPGVPKAMGITSEVKIPGEEKPRQLIFLDSAPGAGERFPEGISELSKIYGFQFLIINSSRKEEEWGDDFHAIICPPLPQDKWEPKTLFYASSLGAGIVHRDNVYHAVRQDGRGTLRVSTDWDERRIPYPTGMGGDLATQIIAPFIGRELASICSEHNELTQLFVDAFSGS